MFQTYATKVAGKEEVLTMYGQSRLFDRRSLAFAIAVVPIGPEAGTYMVHTLEKACEDASFTVRTKIELEKLPGQPAVEWTRPLNRRLQRLFGWGDVAATADDVRRAAQDKNTELLAALVPQAASLIRGNQVTFEQIPALRDVLSSAAPLAIEDRNEEDKDALRRAEHEATGQHTWSEEPNVKAQCSRCCGWDPFECKCGMRLCDGCRQPPADQGTPRYTWRQHPTDPMPFFVLDYAKWPDSEKLAWIRQEIGSNAELEEFTEKWIELFGDKIGGGAMQRAACLKLYRAYAPTEDAEDYQAENSLPPGVLQGFQRLFFQGAPERCRECSKASPRGYSHPIRVCGRPYCSKECEQNQNRIVCRKCKSPECWWDTPSPGCEKREPQPVSFSRYPPWTEWIYGLKQSLDYNPYYPWAQHPMSIEQQHREERKLAERWFQAHFFEPRPVDDREPAWKRRRRS